MTTTHIRPRPAHWPHRADPPGRYWGNYSLYQMRGGLVNLEEEILGLLDQKQAYGDISRFYFFCLAFDQLMKEDVKGDFVELGVYKGHTASLLAKLARKFGAKLWALDTFEGFEQSDLQGIDKMRVLEFADTSLEAVVSHVGNDNVTYVKGFFPETATQIPADTRFSLVHIDCDLYTPIKNALEFFYPRLEPGGYIIIHDYACLAWDGAERAVDEFFAGKSEAIIPLTDGCGSAVIRKQRTGQPSSNWLLKRLRGLFTSEYTSAGKGALNDLLLEGWSGPEAWGVWGVNAAHSLQLFLADDVGVPILAEVDCAAALVAERLSQEIEVFCYGTFCARFNFTVNNNRDVRPIVIPNDLIQTGPWNSKYVVLEFRPTSVVPTSTLNPKNNDSRALGLALFGLRNASTVSSVDRVQP